MNKGQKARYKRGPLLLVVLMLLMQFLITGAGPAPKESSQLQIAEAGGSEVTEDGVEYSKTIRQTDRENEFEITLEVKTKEKAAVLPENKCWNGEGGYWTVTDPLSDMMFFGGSEMMNFKDGFIDANESASFDPETKTVHWKLSEDNSYQITRADEQKEYTYTLKYKVVLNVLNPQFEGGIIYPVNDPGAEAVLTYPAGPADAMMRKAVMFTTPSVYGYSADYSIIKTDEEAFLLPGAEFGLFPTDGSVIGPDAVSMGVSRAENTATGSNALYGNVTFHQVPSGYLYQLKEISVPEGYAPLTEQYYIQVRYGQVSLYKGASRHSIWDQQTATASDSSAKTIINKTAVAGQEYITINGTMNWVNFDPSYLDGVKVQLMADHQPVGDPLSLPNVFAKEDAKWQFVFDQLPKYKAENGSVKEQEINYTIQEVGERSGSISLSHGLTGKKVNFKVSYQGQEECFEIANIYLGNSGSSVIVPPHSRPIAPKPPVTEPSEPADPSVPETAAEEQPSKPEEETPAPSPAASAEPGKVSVVPRTADSLSTGVWAVMLTGSLAVICYYLRRKKGDSRP